MPTKESARGASAPTKESARGASAPTKSPIGAWLKAARMRRNTTQAELARAMGTEQSEITRIEEGEIVPRPELREKLKRWIRSGSRPGPIPKRGPYSGT